MQIMLITNVIDLLLDIELDDGGPKAQSISPQKIMQTRPCLYWNRKCGQNAQQQQNAVEHKDSHHT